LIPETRIFGSSKIIGSLGAEQLTAIFNSLFVSSCNTKLEGGANEPLYLPAGVNFEFNRLIFRCDYISSALHEIAHWCLAGEERRKLTDYGYWYHSDGRSRAQQKIFEAVEVKPQALEWIFSIAAQHSFHASADNLLGDVDIGDCFFQSVVEQAHVWCREPMPLRARLFVQALAEFSGINPLNCSLYKFSEIKSL